MNSMNNKERHELRYQRRKAKRLKKNIERSEEYTNWDNTFGLMPLTEGYRQVSVASKKKPTTQTWMSNLIVNSRKEQKKLKDGTWKSKGFHEFEIRERGKRRIIQNTHISEKGIQNSFCNNCFVPLIKPHLIYDNGASLKGKGTSFSLDEFTQALQNHVKKYGLVGFIYFFDFSSYFANINRSILYNEVEQIIMNKRMMTMYCSFSNALSKSGLGLGSPLSQLSALYYPNKIDHYIKDTLGVKAFGRHMDDGYIICEDLNKLKSIVKEFESMCAEIGIRMNKKKCQIIKITKQFRFLKRRFFITNNGKVIMRLSREVSKRERHRLKKFRKFFDDGIMSARDVYLNFHSWIMSLDGNYIFNICKNAIKYFNELFPELNRYRPLKTNRRKYRIIDYIARSIA